MRLINAVREWNAEGRPALRVIAVYTAADRHATFVREADEAVLIGPGPESEADAAFAGSPYLDYAELERALRACRADAVLARLGVCLREGRVRRAVRPARDHLHRPVGRGDAAARRQDRVQAPGGAGRGAARAVERRPSARSGRRPRGGRIHRLPADGQGDRGRRRPRHPHGPRARRPRGGVRAGQLGGVEDGRGRHGLPGAGHPRRPARRGAGRRRRRGHGVDAGRAGLQRAAAQPEGHRGVRLDRAGRGAGEAAARARRRARPGGRLCQRRDGGVPLRARPEAAVVPRGQHPAAGRAPGHRGLHRHRHRQAAAAHRRGRHAGGDRLRPSRRPAGTPSRPGSPPRIPSATSRPPPA